MTRCAFDPACQREPVAPTSGGTVHAMCAEHESRLLRDAFGAPDRCPGDRLGCARRVGWPCVDLDCPDRTGDAIA